MLGGGGGGIGGARFLIGCDDWGILGAVCMVWGGSWGDCCIVGGGSWLSVVGLNCSDVSEELV